MYLQFVGLPGVGKTTVARRLAEKHPNKFEYRSVEYRTLRELVKIKPVLVFWNILMLAPVVSKNLLDIGTGLCLQDRMIPFVTLLNLLVFYSNRRDKEKFYIIDEFTYQRALSLLGYSLKAPSQWLLGWYLKMLEDYDAIPVFIDLSIDIAMDRAVRRKGGVPRRLSGLSSSQYRGFMDTQSKIIARLKQADQRGISVSATLGIDEMADRIASQLESF